MQIIQTGFQHVSYQIELQKTGYVLNADAPIEADWTGASYRYKLENRGNGKFLPFYRTQGDRTFSVSDPSMLIGFQMLANNGTWLNYARVDDAKCATV